MLNTLLEVINSGVVDDKTSTNLGGSTSPSYNIDMSSFQFGLLVGIIGTIIIGGLLLYIISCIREDIKNKNKEK